MDLRARMVSWSSLFVLMLFTQAVEGTTQWNKYLPHYPRHDGAKLVTVLTRGMLMLRLREGSRQP